MPGPGAKRPSEETLIARHFAPLATSPGAAALQDDAALLVCPPGYSLVVTTDMLVEAVHFLPDDPPATIARKALRVNLSDLAGKGADSVGFLLALALREAWREDWVEAFAAGLAEDIRDFATPLLGGDTVATSGPLTIAVTALGLIPGTAVPRRTNAQAGQGIYVSGTIGDSALGLLARRGEAVLSGLSGTAAAHLVGRYQLPEPRLALASAVRQHACAAMDVSDGLVGDLAKLCRASRVGAEVDVDAVPLSPAMREVLLLAPALLETALTGGDDYEILCTVAAQQERHFEAAAAASGVAVTRIGVVTGEAGLAVFRRQGMELRFAHSSYSHF